MTKNTVVMALLAIALPIQACGELVRAKTVSYSDAVAVLTDKTLIGRRIEVISLSGDITNGKFAGFADGALLLRDAAAVPLCDIRYVRFSRKVSGPLRRTLGIVGGVFTGIFAGSPFALGLALAGAEKAGVITYLAFPVAGGWLGPKLLAKNEDTVYLLDRSTPEPACNDVAPEFRTNPTS
jgi:hypothetical protein